MFSGPRLVPDLATTFAVAFGVVVGGALVGALAALLFRGFPGETALDLADRLKVWGMAAALGGTLKDLRHLEEGLLRMEPQLLMRELVFLASAFAGSVIAYYLVYFLVGSAP